VETPTLPFSAIEASFKKAVAALRDADIEFLLAGSLASWARGGPETQHDLDLIVRAEDAEAALEALAGTGMRVQRPPEEWLYKAWDGEVLIDLIFAPRGLEVDDELFARGEALHVLGITSSVLSIEDLLATKLSAMSEHALDYGGVLQITRALREQIDWRSLRRRTRGSPYATAFFVLVEELGLVPETGGSSGADVRVLTRPARPESGR
jgi:Nucleotidyl transferase of unknown function (DUF2204)